jgi:peptidoglycan/LPS O-acetylase OafA/YrhL
LSTSPRLGRMLAPTGRLSLWVFLLHFPIQQAVWAWLAPSSSPSALGLSLVLALVSVVVAWGLCSLIVRFHHPPR